jgi:ADP-ribosylglycohydrolase
MNKVRDGIIGVAIGDMLGVPVEFTARRECDADL